MAAAILIATPVHCGYWSAEAEKALREDMKAPTL